MEIVDRLGLVEDNRVIAIFIPAVQSILPLRVRYRENRGYEVFEYGPLPISFSGYEPGVLPAGRTTDSITFPYALLPPELAPDMFYYTETGKLLHAKFKFTPSFLRIITEVPQTRKIYSFLGRITQDVTRDFGWFRGSAEMVFLPKIHVGWIFHNPTNMDVRTYVKIIFAEYQVEPVSDPELLYSIVVKKYPAYWIVYGGKYRFLELDESLRNFGIDSADYLIPVPKEWAPREEVLSVIREKVSMWRR